MKFGPVPVRDAEGAILAHAQSAGGRRLKKGTRLAADDVEALAANGLADVVVARLEPSDLAEDEAAAAIGSCLGTTGIDVGPATTGRVNLFARLAGVFLPDKGVVDAVNSVDPGITLATLPAYASVESGRMLATVKIIPLAVPGEAVARAVRVLREAAAIRLAPYRPRRVALIQTELPGVKASVLDKTRRVTEARLAATGSAIVRELRSPHAAGALADAIAECDDAEMILIFGASAVIDRHDVLPSGIELAGGLIEQFGMPVDPGNLLLLGRLGDRRVLGAPGCARSSKENGFDWILNRVLADIPVTNEDIRGMGVGGLLMEIASRPSPRETEGLQGEGAPVIDVVLLAAGRSSRMGGPNKLLARFDGETLLRRSARTARASRAGRVHVVLGHMREPLAAELAGLDVDLVDNPQFAEGLSTSLIAGLAAAAQADGVLVMLADQPQLTHGDLDRLIDAFSPTGEGSIVIATDGGRRANPAILSRVYAAELRALTGDVGARALIAAHPEAVREVEVGRGASLDVDTPEAMHAAGGRFDPDSDMGH
ncbi:NTP transferase domain-containing protein [Mangrovibrevibacter kandeliae]|uniref:NTP transferase domain-containing protein n=1 Tax=Mangrovibrevibacter kandeliae TaxID=2968473 RepID=UPI002117FB46|nr:molybdopterin-binding/glycosyltransferase family 2 protein [Aurantimonas sp. CSK15Z-1]MCQ8782739.1 molybdopterin-binding/glycosyltransferase family 2 protein [Aurantimonas sp. CSK15Z-1]